MGFLSFHIHRNMLDVFLDVDSRPFFFFFWFRLSAPSEVKSEVTFFCCKFVFHFIFIILLPSQYLSPLGDNCSGFGFLPIGSVFHKCFLVQSFALWIFSLALGFYSLQTLLILILVFLYWVFSPFILLCTASNETFSSVII